MKQLRLGITMLCVFVAMVSVSACSNSGSAIIPWHNYPHLFSSAKNKPWLVIMCKVNDNNTEPSGLMFQTQRFLTVGGGGQGNMSDYYSDVSYGAISMVGTKVIGWYTAPFSTTTLNTTLSGPGNRYKRVALCASAVPDADADFGAYWGIIMVTNIPNDGGACYIGQQSLQIHNQTYNLGCVVFDPDSLYTAFAAHEIGHGYGMVHSYDSVKSSCGASPGEYCDPWDIMSALNTKRFAGANFPPTAETQAFLTSHGGNVYDGPGLSVPNLLQAGWLPSKRIAAYHIGSSDTKFTLTALSHPLGPHPLTVEIIGSDPKDIYTVEYRQQDGWDAGIPDNTVLIHEYKIGQSPWSFLERSAAPEAGEWLPGMTWNNLSPTTSTVSVEVQSIDAGAGTATIIIGHPKIFSGTPKINITAPVSGSTFSVGQQFHLVATAISSSGTTLPDSDVTWRTGQTKLGTGKIVTTSLSSPGIYTITATANDHGEIASASVKVYITQQPTPTALPYPTVQIISPTAGQTFNFASGSSFTLTLASNASAGVVAYKWTDSFGMFTDTNANDTLTLSPSAAQAPCGQHTDTITLTVTDNHGLKASAQVKIILEVVCIN